MDGSYKYRVEGKFAPAPKPVPVLLPDGRTVRRPTDYMVKAGQQNLPMKPYPNHNNPYNGHHGGMSDPTRRQR